MKHRVHVLLTASVIVGLVATACGNTSTQQSSASVAHGGTAVYALPVQTAPNWFFPLVSTNADTVVNFQTDLMMYKPLVYFNSQDQFDTNHGLAKAVTWNSEGTVYTIKLNSKWHWSNGNPVTAQDVVFTWDLIKASSQAHSNYAWAFSGQGTGGIPTDWKSVVAENQDTVVVTLTQPKNPQWFIRNGLLEIIPVPKAIWDRYPDNMGRELRYIDSVANSPLNPAYSVVDGPYRLSSYTPNGQWVFVPNRKYDGHPSYLSKVVFQYETSDSSEFAALRTGTVNVGYLSPSLLRDKGQLSNDVLSTSYNLGADYLQLNLNSSAPNGLGRAFAQLPVRQALQMGVDQAAMIHSIFHGYGVVDQTSLAPQPATHFFDPSLKSHVVYPFNPQQGRHLLEQNGWHPVDGVMTKHGIRLAFTLYYASGSNSTANMVQLLKYDWHQEGIDVHLVSEPFDTVVSYSNPTKWQAVDWSSGVAWTYGNDPYPTGGSLFATGAGDNGADYSNGKMDQLIEASYEPGTTQQTLKRLYQYEDYVAQQLPGVIFLPYIPSFNVHAKSIHNTVSKYDPVDTMLNANWWWISQ